MKVLVISDSHGHNDKLRRAVKKEEPFDMLVHLGDLMGAEETLPRLTDSPIYAVAGNCDFFSSLPEKLVFPLGPHRVLAVHGHLQTVSWGLEVLEEEARTSGCDVVMFGHIHQPLIDCSRPGLTVLNPGSIAFPRQEGRKCTYLVLRMDESGKLDPEICSL